MDNGQMPVSAYKSYLVIILLLIVVITGCTYFIKAKTRSAGQAGIADKKEEAPTQEIVETVPFSFFGIKENWNKFAEKVSYQLVFTGIDISSNNAFCDKVEKLSEAFASQKASRMEDDLQKLDDEIGQSSFFEYAEFLKKHENKNKLILRPDMKGSDLALAMNMQARIRIDGAIPDYINEELVQTYAFMNSFCAFFKHNRKAFHKKGIDGNISECKKLHSNGKYPSLDALIDE